MFCLNDTIRYYLCAREEQICVKAPVLSAVWCMRSDVRNGDVFIFIGSSRKLMKLLHAEDWGMVMYVKQLEAGRWQHAQTT
jgi:hypothetical protein